MVKRIIFLFTAFLLLWIAGVSQGADNTNGMNSGTGNDMNTGTGTMDQGTMGEGTTQQPMDMSRDRKMEQDVVKITDPEEGDTVKSGNVDIEWELNKDDVKDADHIHLFVDGQYKKAVVGKNDASVPLTKGEHTIKVVASTKDHKLLEYSDEIKIKVE